MFGYNWPAYWPEETTPDVDPAQAAEYAAIERWRATLAAGGFRVVYEPWDLGAPQED